MVTSVVNVVPMFFFTMMLFEKSVYAVYPKRYDDLDFQIVLEENSNYAPMPEMCPLKTITGERADIDQIPYQAVLLKGNSQGTSWGLVCGGAIVAKQYILTAAHCFTRTSARKLEFYKVVVGSSDSYSQWKRKRRNIEPKSNEHQTETWINITNCFRHKSFEDYAVINHDLAVLKLQYPLNFSFTIRPIPMMKSSYRIALREKAWALVSGYENNTTSTRLHLRRLCVPLLAWDKCKKFYGDERVTHNQFCTSNYGTDSCQLDSGGPVTYKGYLLGIVAYGGGCEHSPGVYTKLTAYTTGETIPFGHNHSNILRINIYAYIYFLVVFVKYFIVMECVKL